MLMSDRISLRSKWNNLKRNLKKKKYMRPIMFLWKIYRNINGHIFLNKIISKKPENTIYILVSGAMGDGLYALSSLEALHQKYPNKKIVLLAPSKWRELFSSFKHIDEFIFCSERDTWRLGCVCEVPNLVPREISHWIINGYVYMHLLSLRKITIDDSYDTIHIFRKVLGINENAPITYHGLQCCEIYSIKNFDALKNRIVIINPYSGSMRTTMEIYEAACEKLNSLGYLVFTNVVGEQKEIRGSQPLKCSIYELYSIACRISLIFSIRSGILDLLIPSGISMFVIYDMSSEWKGYRLSSWRSKCKIQELNITSESEIKLIPEKFSHFLDELKAEGRIS